MNVMKQNNSALLLLADLGDDALRDGIRHGIGPILGIDVPDDGLHVVRLDLGQNVGVGGAYMSGRKKSRRRLQDVGQERTGGIDFLGESRCIQLAEGPGWL